MKDVPGRMIKLFTGIWAQIASTIHKLSWWLPGRPPTPTPGPPYLSPPLHFPAHKTKQQLHLIWKIIILTWHWGLKVILTWHWGLKGVETGCWVRLIGAYHGKAGWCGHCGGIPLIRKRTSGSDHASHPVRINLFQLTEEQLDFHTPELLFFPELSNSAWAVTHFHLSTSSGRWWLTLPQPALELLSSQKSLK